MRRSFCFAVGGMLAALLTAGPAFAHTFGAHGAGFAAGLAHPFGGLDHLVVMVAVGLWAVQLGGRAIWVVPASFVGAMVAGGAMSLAGIALPHVELGIAASVVALGLLVGTAFRMPTWAGALLVGLFAVLHGHAHGSEIPQAASEVGYAAGFVLATATLHGIGIGLGFLSRRIAARPILRAAGAVMALVGLAFAFAS